MDAKLFRVTTTPNYYETNSVPVINNRTPSQLPSPDSRFPGWAAPMSDGRLVTDYSAHCESSIPVGKQFPTKHWMQNHATEIINASRQLSATRTGAGFPFDPTVVPPPQTKVFCKPDSCSRVTTHAPGGIGIEREGAVAPELFGTYNPVSGIPAPPAKISLTSQYEGGRNSIRGLIGPSDL